MKRIPRHRRKNGRTDYEQRLQLLKSGKPRLVVRITNTRIITQLITYDHDGDNVIANANSDELEELGWEHAHKNIPAAYLTGRLLATRADEQQAVLDIGLHTPEHGGRLFAAAKGASDGGLDIPLQEHVVPDESRLKGEHIDATTAFNTVQEQV